MQKVMKKLAVLCGAAVLAGCAASGNGELALATLETPNNLRAERWVPKTFVQVQRAVFQHQAACKVNIKFQVDDLHPSYARVFMNRNSEAGQDTKNVKDVMVLGLQRLDGMPSKGRVYSYYKPTDDQIQQLYDAVLLPTLCPGDPRPPEPAKDKD